MKFDLQVGVSHNRLKSYKSINVEAGRLKTGMRRAMRQWDCEKVRMEYIEDRDERMWYMNPTWGQQEPEDPRAELKG